LFFGVGENVPSGNLNCCKLGQDNKIKLNNLLIFAIVPVPLSASDMGEMDRSFILLLLN
jgi:hypothetical protein